MITLFIYRYNQVDTIQFPEESKPSAEKVYMWALLQGIRVDWVGPHQRKD